MTIAEQICAEEALAHKLEQYRGQWVAVREHQVVAAADTLEELLEQAEEAGSEVEVFQVAEDPNQACFF